MATSEGALLLWATGGCARGVELQRFDADGAPVGESSKIAACGAQLPSVDEGEVSELAAAAGGGHLGVLWRVQGDRAAQVYATFGPDTAVSLAPTLPLGAANADAQAARGELWLSAAQSGQLRAAFRAPAIACSSESGQCAQLVSFVLSQQAQTDSAVARRSDTREVPYPCPRLLVGSLWTQGTWYDAFCALDRAAGQPTTEVYAIRPEIFYAEASPALQGCTPSGVAPSDGGVVIFGECVDGTRVQALHDGRRTTIERAQRVLQCAAGRPTLTVRGERGLTETYKMAGPRDRLELWLPDTMAGSGSRAAFTGRRLLVATLQTNRLGLRSYRCDGETVVSESPTML